MIDEVIDEAASVQKAYDMIIAEIMELGLDPIDSDEEYIEVARTGPRILDSFIFFSNQRSNVWNSDAPYPYRVLSRHLQAKAETKLSIASLRCAEYEIRTGAYK